MEAYEAVVSKLDLQEFASKNVPSDVQLKVLDAGRLTGSGMNYQHWKFILVRGRDRLKTLADDSTTGGWVAEANFAIIVMTNPKFDFHLLDAGRATQSMQIAAWSFGVVSRIFTGVNRDALEKDFGIPKELNPSVVIGFGYPTRKILGRKKRKPMNEVAFLDRFGNQLSSDRL